MINKAMFTKDIYISRRNLLKKQVGSGVILLPGNNEMPRNFADNSFQFRQDSTFLYYTGLNEPGLALLLDVESGEEIVFGNESTIDQAIWTGSLPGLQEKAAMAGIEKGINLSELAEIITRAVRNKRIVHFLPPYSTDRLLFLENLLGIKTTLLPSAASEVLIKAVVAQRQCKTEEEIKEIEHAVNVSVDMHEAAMRMVRPGMMERDVVAEVTKVAVARSAGLSFQVIATINGQILHNHDYSHLLEEGQMFLLDAGAESAAGYAGDLSSTFPVGRAFTSKQRDIYEICLASHEAAIGALGPGVVFKEIYYKAARTILEGMKEMKLVRGSLDDALAAGVHGMFFPCGLGHMLGLDVHDMEDLGEQLVGWGSEQRPTQFGIRSLRLGKTLQPGFVLTIEPGIYFIPELIDLWRKEKINHQFLDFERIEKFRYFGGIRNEENFLITDTSYRLLGKKKAKTVPEIELMRQSD